MWLNVLPVDGSLALPTVPFLLALRRRLSLELPAGPARCRCGAELDPWGNHFLACRSAGRLARRGNALELAFAQLLREAGGPSAQVATRPRIRDLAASGVSAHDQRELDVVARGLPLFDGRFIILDVTLRSSFSSAGAVLAGSSPPVVPGAPRRTGALPMWCPGEPVGQQLPRVSFDRAPGASR